MADHGFPGAVVRVTEPGRQVRIWGVREAALNILMSMKGDAKPVSFIEDCAVPLQHLEAYTAAITDLFARHGTSGTWYAHASVGCLHVRPILNMKTPEGVAAMRSIADEAFALVRRFEGSHSGEHGDGISRSDSHRAMYGDRVIAAFEAVKDAFDPAGRLNPGKIVRPYAMDDRSLMRFAPGYAAQAPARAAMDWSGWGGFGAAVEMCNNNGTCRKTAGGVMCPSFRVTRDETHVTRGRANTLRLAASGQLGPDALTGPLVAEAMDLCVSCKACRRECPTGVDMARMKIEVTAQRVARHGLPLRERLVAHLPDYAHRLGPLRGLANLRDRVPGAAWLSEKLLGFAADRPLPAFRRPWREAPPPVEGAAANGPVVLLGDCFNRNFEPANLSAGAAVLDWAGFRRMAVQPKGRPLCCGRTFLSAGMVDRARAEARRTYDALAPALDAGARIVGLEPSCLLTLRDEWADLLPAPEARRIADAALLIEELLADALAGDRLPEIPEGPAQRAHLHGHCHQKAFGCMGAVETVLRAMPGLEVEAIESSCCGMAGPFGYQAEHAEASRAMAELSLLPAVRAAGADDLIVADGTSCRHQIADGSGRDAVHVALVLARRLRLVS